jgi:hypothetical protein
MRTETALEKQNMDAVLSRSDELIEKMSELDKKQRIAEEKLHEIEKGNTEMLKKIDKLLGNFMNFLE